MSKIENGTLSLGEKSGQDRDLMTETTRKKVIKRAASNRAGNKVIIIILKRYGSG